MDTNNSSAGSKVRSLLMLALLIGVPAGLAVMYPQEAREAYERAGQIVRGEYGPVDLIPPGGKVVKVDASDTDVTDVQMPSMAEVVAAQEARTQRTLDEAAAEEAAASAQQPEVAAPAPSALPTLTSASAPGAPAETASSPTAAPAAPAAPATAQVGLQQAAPAPAPVHTQPSSGARESVASAQTSVASPEGTADVAQNAKPAAVFEAPTADVAKPTKPNFRVDASTVAGIWEGEFSGPASGKLSLVASGEGQLRGRLVSNETRRPVIVEGRILSPSGDLEFHQLAGKGVVSPWNFIGRLSPEGGEGQWTSDNPQKPSGTWSLYRSKAGMDEARAVMQHRLDELKQ